MLYCRCCFCCQDITYHAWQWLRLNLTSCTPGTAWGIVFLLDSFLILRKKPFSNISPRRLQPSSGSVTGTGMSSCLLTSAKVLVCALYNLLKITVKIIRMCGTWKSRYLKLLKQLLWLITGTWIYRVGTWGLLVRLYTQQRCSPSDPFPSSFLSDNQMKMQVEGYRS